MGLAAPQARPPLRLFDYGVYRSNAPHMQCARSRWTAHNAGPRPGIGLSVRTPGKGWGSERNWVPGAVQAMRGMQGRCMRWGGSAACQSRSACGPTRCVPPSLSAPTPDAASAFRHSQCQHAMWSGVVPGTDSQQTFAIRPCHVCGSASDGACPVQVPLATVYAAEYSMQVGKAPSPRSHARRRKISCMSDGCQEGGWCGLSCLRGGECRAACGRP